MSLAGVMTVPCQGRVHETVGATRNPCRASLAVATHPIVRKVRFSALTRGRPPRSLRGVIEPPPPYDVAALGLSIAKARQAAKLTLEQLAERSGISRRQLIDIEQANKTPLITTLHAIAHGLNLPVGQLAQSGCADGAPSPARKVPVP